MCPHVPNAGNLYEISRPRLHTNQAILAYARLPDQLGATADMAQVGSAMLDIVLFRRPRMP